MKLEFINALEEIQREKGVSKEILLEAIEAALISSYKRNFGSSQNVRVNIEEDTGEIQVYSQKNVVEVVEDDTQEVTLEEAKEKNPNYEIGDIVEEEVTPRNFGRIAAQTAKQVVVQRIREAERGVVYEEYVNRASDIITGTISRVSKGLVFVDLGKTEGILEPNEQVTNEEYVHNQRVKAYILEVKRTTKGPQILLSRSHPGLVKRLFELEVPEIHDGVVEVVGISREAGFRSKLAVKSLDENVDPVGACVGHKGSRVQRIVEELSGEKMDIIKYSDDPKEFITAALSPSKVVKVMTSEKDKAARVIVPDYQLSLTIGKEGQNARLAAKLTGWKIDIKSETQHKEAGSPNFGAEENLEVREDMEGSETLVSEDNLVEEENILEDENLVTEDVATEEEIGDLPEESSETETDEDLTEEDFKEEK